MSSHKSLFRTSCNSWYAHQMPALHGGARPRDAVHSNLLAFTKSAIHKVVRASSITGLIVVTLIMLLDTRYFYSLLRTIAVTAAEEVGYHDYASFSLLHALASLNGVCSLSGRGYQSRADVWSILKFLWNKLVALVLVQPPNDQVRERFSSQMLMNYYEEYQSQLEKASTISKKTSVKPFITKRAATTAKLEARFGQQARKPENAMPASFQTLKDATTGTSNAREYIDRVHKYSNNLSAFIDRTKKRIQNARAFKGVDSHTEYQAFAGMFLVMCPAIHKRISDPSRMDKLWTALENAAPANVLQDVLVCKRFFYMQLKRNDQSAECILFVGMAAQAVVAGKAPSTPTAAYDFSYVKLAWDTIVNTDGFDETDEADVTGAYRHLLGLFNQNGALNQLGDLILDMHVGTGRALGKDKQFFYQKSGRLYSQGEICPGFI